MTNYDTAMLCYMFTMLAIANVRVVDVIAPPHATCPACGGTFEHFRHGWLYRCPDCRLLASNQEPAIPELAGASVIDEERRVCACVDIRTRNNSIILEQLEKLLPAGRRRLLDVGSGPGFFLKDAAARHFDVTGIEPDANVVEAARQTGVSVRHGYFPQCLEPGDSFDVIVFNDVFEHIPDLAGTIAACGRHLAGGGLLVLNCPNRGGSFYRIADALDRIGFHGPFDRMWLRRQPSPHLWYFGGDDLRRIGERYGFGLAAMFDLMPITLRGLSHRIFAIRDQSRLMGAAALVGTLLLSPFLAVLPRDISVVMLKKMSS